MRRVCTRAIMHRHVGHATSYLGFNSNGELRGCQFDQVVVYMQHVHNAGIKANLLVGSSRRPPLCSSY